MSMRALFRLRHDERGSMPLTLLAIIVISATVAALVASTLAGTRAARFDLAFTPLVLAADAGVQEGAHAIIRDATYHDVVTYPPGSVIGPFAGSTPEGTYTWTATRCGATPAGACADVPPGDDSRLTWLIESTAVQDGVTRTVAAQVQDEARFKIAAFAIDYLEMQGANTANGYGAGGYITGEGIVGSNGVVRLIGNAGSGVEGVHLWNWALDPGAHRCVGSANGSKCDDFATDPPAGFSATFDDPLAIGSGLDTVFIEEQLDACRAASPTGTLADLTYAGGSIGTAGTTTVLCAQNLRFDDSVTVLGEVAIYVAGDISIDKQIEVNCPACTTASTPDASALQLYSAGTAVRIGNQAEVAAGIYAPLADCGGNPSGAQAHIYGSIVCDVINNVGGWRFSYDTRLAGIGTGEYELQAWREELASAP